jgi:hypothetical protein
MMMDELEKILSSLGREIRREKQGFSFDLSKGVKAEKKGDDVLLSSFVGILSEIPECNYPNVIIGFLDANHHIQPASVGIAVGENDISISATVLLDRELNEGSVKRSLEALDLAIRAASSIMENAAAEAMT